MLPLRIVHSYLAPTIVEMYRIYLCLPRTSCYYVVCTCHIQLYFHIIHMYWNCLTIVVFCCLNCIIMYHAYCSTYQFLSPNLLYSVLSPHYPLSLPLLAPIICNVYITYLDVGHPSNLFCFFLFTASLFFLSPFSFFSMFSIFGGIYLSSRFWWLASSYPFSFLIYMFLFVFFSTPFIAAHSPRPPLWRAWLERRPGTVSRHRSLWGGA